MFLLSIDTCGITGTLALARLLDENLTLLAQAELPGKTYSARLAPTMREILASHDIVPAALAAIVVASGLYILWRETLRRAARRA